MHFFRFSKWRFWKMDILKMSKIDLLVFKNRKNTFFFSLYIKVLYYIVYSIHLIIIAIIWLGVLLPTSFLPYYLFSAPFILLHWELNGNKCILTQLEHKILQKPPPPTIYLYYARLFNKYGINISSETTRKIIVYSYLGLLFVALFRYFF